MNVVLLLQLSSADNFFDIKSKNTEAIRCVAAYSVLKRKCEKSETGFHAHDSWTIPAELVKGKKTHF